MKEIGKKIRDLRKEKKLTQEELSEKLGVSAQAVSKWEKEISLPDISVLLPLCELLGVGVDSLLGGNRKNELEEKFQQALRLGEKATLAVSEEALREFPEDKIWLSRRAHDEYILATDGKNEYYLRLSTRHYRQLCRKFPEDDIYKSYLAELLFLLGEKDEAFALAYKCKEKDNLLKKILEGEALENHKRTVLKKKLDSFLSELYDYNTLEALDLSEKLINMFEYDIWLWRIYARRAEIYLKSGDMEQFSLNKKEAERWAEFSDKKGAWKDSVSATEQLRMWNFPNN